MGEVAGNASAEYNLADWERALTIHVGTAYACRECENLVMVTKGGVGVLDLICCDKPMEEITRGFGTRRQEER